MIAIYLVTVNYVHENAYIDNVYACECDAVCRAEILNKKFRHPEMEWTEIEKHFVIEELGKKSK